MTPQEALAQAVKAATDNMHPRDWTPNNLAAAILDALPVEVRRAWEEVIAEHYAEPGDCMMCEQYDYGVEQGAQQERERLRAMFAHYSVGRRAGYMHSNASVLRRLADPEDEA